MRTEYDLPAFATAQQKQQVIRVADATARRLDFAADITEMERMHEAGAQSFRRYFKGSLVLGANITHHVTYVFLRRNGRTKTPDFIATEELLTAALRRISPDVVIITGYVQNPMM